MICKQVLADGLTEIVLVTCLMNCLQPKAFSVNSDVMFLVWPAFDLL